MNSGSGTRGPRPDWHAARHQSFLASTPLGATVVRLSEAVGRTVASNVVALCEVPHYASSAMDGWAVSGLAPWRLVSATTLAAGEATLIATGGLAEADGVLISPPPGAHTGESVQMLALPW